MFADYSEAGGVEGTVQRLLKGLETVPNQLAGKPGDVDVLAFTERGPKLAVRPYTHTSHCWAVYFNANRMIVDVLAGAGCPCHASPRPFNRAPHPPTRPGLFLPEGSSLRLIARCRLLAGIGLLF